MRSLISRHSHSILIAFLALMAQGIGCEVIAYDRAEKPDLVAMGVKYMAVEEMLPRCDILTLHCPLTPETYHIIDARRIAMFKPGCMLINVSRGGLVDR